MSGHIKIGIVGHTNTGKTSLMRTLLRNSHFGEVKDQAGTTRHVESASIRAGSLGEIELRDTPGLEDSSGLKAWIEDASTGAVIGRAALTVCIEKQGEIPEFEQEIKVIKQCLTCDVLFYVVDSREPAFEKYIDEIQVLKLASVPIVPVLNFIHFENTQLDSWRNTLAELGLHALVLFDTVAYDFASEKRLYQKLQTLIEPQYDLIQAIIDQRAQDWQNLAHTVCKRIAKLFLDVCKIEITIDENSSKDKSLKELQAKISALEQAALHSVLKLMQFDENDIAMFDLPVEEGRWRLDLFSPETLKHLGMDSASAIAAGASVGVGADLLLGGLSLGAGAATGAALGAVWHGGRKWGKSVIKQLRGVTCVRIDDDTLDILLLRQLWLLQTVFNRGHAAVNASQLKSKPSFSIPEKWNSERKKLRLASLKIGQSEQQFLEHFSLYLSSELDKKPSPS